MNASLRLAAAVSAICAIAPLCAEEQPKFEVASVKRTGQGMIKNVLGPGTVTLKGDPLQIVLMEAFQVKAYQIVGPAWLEEECFDIIAKMPEGSSNEQIPAMLRALLAERFQLATHREERPRPVYALVVEKNGPKFKEASLNFRRMGPRSGVVAFRAAADTRGFKGDMTMASLARFLANHLDRPVQDLTGLSGTYTIDLSWAPDPTIDRPSRFAEATRAAMGDAGVDLPAAPTSTLFTAIRDALGLKLEPHNGKVEMLVIDHVERVPVGN